jgi:DNA-binding LytR/AlgR family response regulator
MSLAREMKNVYEDFEIEKDILFFKVDARARGLVSFHGSNYNIKKRMTSDQLDKLIAHTKFVKVKSDCFVNIGKITSIENDNVYFGEELNEDKRLHVSKWKQFRLKHLWQQVN